MLGIIVCRGHVSFLFLEILSSDEILFLSIMFCWVHQLETGSHSKGQY